MANNPQQLVNDLTRDLRPYPMEALSRIRAGLEARGVPVYDFGTGDPRIPYWPKIADALKESIPKISQYPSSKGAKFLLDAQIGYLNTRFGIQKSDDIEVCSSNGSKEAIFHVALSIVGRAGGKKTIIYPDPGYPVYRSSTLFAAGRPYPVRLSAEHNYLLKPWLLPAEVQKDTAAIWINYPHNPTGAVAPRSYFEEIITWAHKNDVLVLSDDCYVDIYDCKIDEERLKDPSIDRRPFCPLLISSDRVLTFMSLSKRSGLTGYRSGLIAGDARFLRPHFEARANMGVGSPNFIQTAAAVAWSDEDHVCERRRVFSARIDLCFPYLHNLGLLDQKPEAAFYMWCKIPERFGEDDVGFVAKLAERGVITSPSSWLSEGMRGYFRLALVPEDKDTIAAMEILKDFLNLPA